MQQKSNLYESTNPKKQYTPNNLSGMLKSVTLAERGEPPNTVIRHIGGRDRPARCYSDLIPARPTKLSHFN